MCALVHMAGVARDARGYQVVGIMEIRDTQPYLRYNVASLNRPVVDVPCVFSLLIGSVFYLQRSSTMPAMAGAVWIVLPVEHGFRFFCDHVIQLCVHI